MQTTLRPPTTEITRADKLRQIERYLTEANRLLARADDLRKSMAEEDETMDGMTNAYRGDW